MCWPLVPKFAGSNPAEAVGFLGRKNPQHAFLRRGSKAVGPMYKIPKFTWKSEFSAKLPDNFSPTVPPFATRISCVVTGVEAPGGEGGND